MPKNYLNIKRATPLMLRLQFNALMHKSNVERGYANLKYATQKGNKVSYQKIVRIGVLRQKYKSRYDSVYFCINVDGMHVSFKGAIGSTGEKEEIPLEQLVPMCLESIRLEHTYYAENWDIINTNLFLNTISKYNNKEADVTTLKYIMSVPSADITPDWEW